MAPSLLVMLRSAEALIVVLAVELLLPAEGSGVSLVTVAVLEIGRVALLFTVALK